jgi:menaquinone-dependent protoporphyrinogen oxidase
MGLFLILGDSEQREDMLLKTENVEQGKISRRSFLVLVGGTISTLSLGSIPLAGCNPAAAIEFPESKCGRKGKMDKKILVAYASKYGSTGGVADAIGKELCDRGAAVDVCMLKNVGDLNEYRGVVVGSAIYRGKWLSEAVDFVERNRGVLRQVPVAYFLVCITMCKPTEESHQKALAYLDAVLKAVPQVQPVKVGTFAGALDYSNLSLPIKLIMKLKGAPEGDFRNWGAISAWATSLHEIHELADSFHPALARV